MRKFLYDCVSMISKIHDKIMQLNNAYEANLSDKELHFFGDRPAGTGYDFRGVSAV